MAKTISQFKLGLFILLCGSIGLMAIIWLGASHYFEKKKIFVTYFAESIKGLQKDAVVNYLGVPVGRVAHIGLAPDGRLIEVVLHLKPEFEVDHSLVIRLLEMGLTGLRYLEIVSAPADTQRVTARLAFPLNYPLIPSYPSEITQLKSGLETLYSKIIEVDLQGLVERWKETGDLANAVLADKNLGTTLQNVKTSSDELSALLSKINAATSGKELRASIDELNKSLAASRRGLEALAQQLEALPPNALANLTNRLEQVLKTGETTIVGWDQETGKVLAALLQNLDQSRQVLEQLRQLVQSVRAQPQQILFHPATPDPFERK
jgi:ABC-type transporter Mla subunit MlaD